MSDLNETVVEEQNAAATPEPMPEKKMVPLSALQQERATRKELQQRLARMEERFREFMAAKEAPTAAPDPAGEADDPIAGLKAAHDRTSQTVEQIRAALAQRQLAELREAAQAQFAARYHEAVRDFAQRVPDFADAYKHACADRDAELTELGYADPALRRQIIAAEESAIVGRAMQDGADPAERIYKLAQRRGYRGVPAEGDAAAKLAAAARGQAAARSLSAAGGAEPIPPRLEDLAEMSDEDFAAATQGANWRRLLQG